MIFTTGLAQRYEVLYRYCGLTLVFGDYDLEQKTFIIKLCSLYVIRKNTSTWIPDITGYNIE